MQLLFFLVFFRRLRYKTAMSANPLSVLPAVCVSHRPCHEMRMTNIIFFFYTFFLFFLFYRIDLTPGSPPNNYLLSGESKSPEAAEEVNLRIRRYCQYRARYCHHHTRHCHHQNNNSSHHQTNHCHYYTRHVMLYCHHQKRHGHYHTRHSHQ